MPCSVRACGSSCQLPSAEIGEASTGNETLTCLQRAEWDLLVLDINMPDRSGLDILRHVRSGHPGTRVLVLSGYPERQYALNVLRAGASRIAGTARPKTCLAVRMVPQGRRHGDSLAELLLLDLDQADKPPHSLLDRVPDLGKLAAGHGVSEIGRSCA
jgi:DNA-binding NarL/FixJ family response regulator